MSQLAKQWRELAVRARKDADEFVPGDRRADALRTEADVLDRCAADLKVYVRTLLERAYPMPPTAHQAATLKVPRAPRTERYQDRKRRLADEDQRRRDAAAGVTPEMRLEAAVNAAIQGAAARLPKPKPKRKKRPL